MPSDNHTPIPDGYKRCSKGDQCVNPDGPILPVSEFYRQKSAPSGLRSTCKVCHKIENRNWNKIHPEYKKNWEIDQRQNRNAYMRDYMRTRSRYQTPELKDQKRVYMCEYRQTEKARMNKCVENARRRAKRRILSDVFEASDWQYCLVYFDNQCAVCGRIVNYTKDLFGSYTLSLDHWIPLSSPDCPGTIATNIVPLCYGDGGCNNSKRNKDAHEWLMEKHSAQETAKIEKRIQRYFKIVEKRKKDSNGD